jgi:head-tail adaptor
MHLPHLLTFERRGTSQSSTGQVIENWGWLGQVYGRIGAVSGSEYVAGSGERAEVALEIAARSTREFAPTPADRIKCGVRIFDIKSIIDPDGRGRWWKIAAREVVG